MTIDSASPRFDLPAFLALCREHPGGQEPAKALIDASNELLPLADQDEALRNELLAALPGLPPAGIDWLAVLFGMMVEHGVSPEASAPVLWGVLDRWLALLADPEGEATMKQAVLDSMPRLCTAVVTHLAAMPTWREQLAQDESLLQRLEEGCGDSHAIEWVRTAILRSSGTVIALHPTSRQGFKLRFDNVGQAFQLFTLMQSAIGTQLPGGRVPDPLPAAVARGQASVALTDQAWWHYGDPHCAEPHLMGSIWGEVWVRWLPKVDGQHVILLWPPLLGGRSWEAGFLTPHIMQLPSDVQVLERLTPQECKTWLDRLGVGAAKPVAEPVANPPSGGPHAERAPPRPWWKFWH